MLPTPLSNTSLPTNDNIAVSRAHQAAQAMELELFEVTGSDADSLGDSAAVDGGEFDVDELLDHSDAIVGDLSGDQIEAAYADSSMNDEELLPKVTIPADDEVSGSALQSFFRAMRKHSRLLSAEEEVTLARRLRDHDDREARDTLFNHNLRLAISLAATFKNRGVEFEELVSWAAQGLLKGVHAYDPERGFRLSTYATWWIKQQCREAITNAPIIPIPPHWKTKIRRIERSVAEAVAAGDTAGAESLREKLATATAALAQMRNETATVSVDQTIGAGDEGMTLMDFIQGSCESPEDILERKQTCELYVKACEVITNPRDKDIFLSHLGLADDGFCEAQSFRDIAERVGLSYERVSQICGTVSHRLVEEVARLAGGLQNVSAFRIHECIARRDGRSFVNATLTETPEEVEAKRRAVNLFLRHRRAIADISKLDIFDATTGITEEGAEPAASFLRVGEQFGVSAKYVAATYKEACAQVLASIRDEVGDLSTLALPIEESLAMRRFGDIARVADELARVRQDQRRTYGLR